MHLMKIKKRVFKREFLDYRLVVIVFDVYEMSQEEENTVIEVNKIFYVLPMVKGMEEEQEADKLLEQHSRLGK